MLVALFSGGSLYSGGRFFGVGDFGVGSLIDGGRTKSWVKLGVSYCKPLEDV